MLSRNPKSSTGEESLYRLNPEDLKTNHSFFCIIIPYVNTDDTKHETGIVTLIIDGREA